jgi:hypothetical protein
MPFEKSYTKCNNKSQIFYKGMPLQKIAEFYAEWFSVCANVTSECRTIAIFKSSAKKHNDSNKTCMNVHSHSLHRTSFFKFNGSWVVSIKQNENRKFQHSAMFLVFLYKTVSLTLHTFNVYEYTAFNGPTQTGQSFAPTSEVWTSAILEWLKLRG